MKQSATTQARKRKMWIYWVMEERIVPPSGSSKPWPALVRGCVLLLYNRPLLVCPLSFA